MFLPRMRHLLLLLSIAIVVVAKVFRREGSPFDLPGNLVPEHYDLTVETEMGDDQIPFSFSGHVHIRVKCLNTTDRIIMSAVLMAIDWITVESIKPTENIAVTSHELIREFLFLAINVSTPLIAGKLYTLNVGFSSKTLIEVGYFRMDFFNELTNRNDWMSATHFEFNFAPVAFPCFDDPKMKATFSVTLGHHKDWQALSNMPMIKQTKSSNRTDWVYDHFAKTIKMSVYLVAYSINRFAHRDVNVQMSDGRTILLRGWTARPLEQIDFALEMAKRVLLKLEAFVDYKLPCEKIDMIAVHNFPVGGMENWGLITYAEVMVLTSSRERDDPQRYTVGMTVAHELTHQWFGNLVTLKEWKLFWLNEGFTNYVSSMVYNSIAYEHFGGATPDVGLENFVSILTDPQIIDSSLHIGVGGTTIASYYLGAAVMRMAEAMLGVKAMRKCLHRYVKLHAYGNVEDRDWWSLVAAEIAGDNHTAAMVLEDRMMEWITRSGLPEVLVKRDYAKKTITLTQQRFQDASGQLAPSCRSIPIAYKSDMPKRRSLTIPALTSPWLSCHNSTTPEKLTLSERIDSKRYFLLNADLAVPYHVRYDKQNWHLLLDLMSGPQFHTIVPRTRAQLMDDYFRSLKKKSFPKKSSRLVKWLQQEDAVLPWSAALNHMIVRWPNTTEKDKRQYQKRFHETILPVFKRTARLESNGVLPVDSTMLQSLIVLRACENDLFECNQLAYEYILALMSATDPNIRNPIPVNLRPAIYCRSVQLGGKLVVKFLGEHALVVDTFQEKKRIATALEKCEPNADNATWFGHSDSRYSPGLLFRTYAVMICRFIKNLSLKKFNIAETALNYDLDLDISIN